MKRVNELISGVDIKKMEGDLYKEVKFLSDNHNDVGEKSIFFAIKGGHTDGHKYVRKAYEQGCRVFVVEREIGSLKDSTIIITGNSRITFSKMSANFFNNPSENLSVYGITGSTGKTTVIYLLRNLTSNSATLGSEGKFINNEVLSKGEGLLTTPGPFKIHEFLNMCLKKKVEKVFLEVSSFGLMNFRVEDVKFKGGIFLNLYPSHHLMIHKSILNYLKAKMHLLDLVHGPFILNGDDPYSSYFMENERKNRILLYSKREKLDFFVKEKIVLNREFLFILNLLGEEIDLSLSHKSDLDIFLPVLALLKVIYGNVSPFIKKLRELKNPPGRWNVLSNKPLIVVDKCNTPPCFKRINELFPSVKRKILLFSFFEEEDIRETIEIFMLVNKIFNFVIVTSDDTKTKTPFMCNRNFIKLLKKGGIPFKFIEDRKEAIKFGISLLNRNDGLFILGRGDESFMFVRGNKVKYSDVDTVKEIVYGIKRK